MDVLTKLLAGLVDSVEADEAAAIAASGRLEVDGVPVALQPGGETDPAALLAYFELGPLPAGQPGRDAIDRLMEFNLALYRRNAPQFGLDGEAREAMMMLRIETDGLDAESLRRTLADHAALARAWRQTRFADGSLALLVDAAPRARATA